MKNPKRIYSPIRYAGGKTKAATLIAGHIPPTVERLVSPFVGGASLEVFIAKTRPEIEVIGYDIFQLLTEFWDVILTKPKELADAVAEYSPTKACFTETREKLKEWWAKYEPIVKRNEEIKFQSETERMEVVAMYYFNHQYSYGPMFLGWPSSVYLKPKVHKNICQRLREFECPNLKIRWGDFHKSIRKHKDDFLYVDPPYFDASEDGNALFKPLYPNCNFPIHHRGFDHEGLRDLLKAHEAGWILSYNDCPTISDWYEKDERYTTYRPKWHYSYSQGEKRIGENREGKMKTNEAQMTTEQKKEAQRKESHEVLIVNSGEFKRMNADTFGLCSDYE